CEYPSQSPHKPDHIRPVGFQGEKTRNSTNWQTANKIEGRSDDREKSGISSSSRPHGAGLRRRLEYVCEWRNRKRMAQQNSAWPHRADRRPDDEPDELARAARLHADGTDTEPTGWHGKRCPRPSSPHPPTATRTGSRPRLPRPDRDATGPTTVSPSRLDSATRPRRRPLIAREHHHHPRVTVLVERTTTSVSVVTACNSGSSPSVTSRPTPPRAGPPPNTNASRPWCGSR